VIKAELYYVFSLIYFKYEKSNLKEKSRMKKVIIATLLLCMGISVTQAQLFYGWTADATTATQSNIQIRANAVTVDSRGNVYTTGSFRGTVDFDPGAGVVNLVSNGGNQDIFITKLNASGNLVWAKSMGSTSNLGDFGYSIAVNPNGDIYTAGGFSGTVDFDPGSGTFNITSAGSQDIFIQKLDSTGAFLWAKNFGSSQLDACESIATDNLGNVYATGNFFGTVDFDPSSNTFNLFSPSIATGAVFILKLDIEGNFIWAKSIFGFDGISEEAYGIAVDADYNVYTTGIFTGITDFEPETGTGTQVLTSIGSFDIFIQKLNAAGSLVWAKNMGGTQAEFPYAIAVDGDKNVYTTGIFQSTADFDPDAGTANLTSAGSNDVFISKLNTNGDYVWAKRIGTTSEEEARGIAVDGYKAVYITGTFTGTVDFDPGTGVANLTSNGGADFYTVKLDSLGNYIWANATGADASEESTSIALDGNNNLYTTGRFTNTVNMNPTGGTDNKSANNIAIFTRKLNACNISSLANNLDNDSLTTRNVGGYYLEFQKNCNTICRYQPNSSLQSVQGRIAAKVWIEPVQPASIGNQFVKRHYEISPATNAATATGRVTLYFTQAEFDDFNAVSNIDLPTNPSDALGKANLVIEKRQGVSNDGTGLPSSYSGIPSNINPNDNDIVWSNDLNRWEVSFDVTGFSGFFVKSSFAVLPVRWLSINGSIVQNRKVRLQWEVEENNVSEYAIEKTYDNINWISVSTIPSKGDGRNSYQYYDNDVLSKTIFYRIKQIDKNGLFKYSSIIRILPSINNTIVIFPSPVTSQIQLQGVTTGNRIIIFDATGKQMLSQIWNGLPLHIEQFPSGVYTITIITGKEVINKQIIKQ
jgi:hypothetical protein